MHLGWQKSAVHQGSQVSLVDPGGAGGISALTYTQEGAQLQTCFGYGTIFIRIGAAHQPADKIRTAIAIASLCHQPQRVGILIAANLLVSPQKGAAPGLR
jgi:hypothetical protein